MKKILLIRFSSIGDIVLTTPVARCLKNQLGATVHFLTKKGFFDLLEPNPNIDRIYTFDKNIAEVIPALREEKYDYVIDLHHNLRSLQVKWALHRPSDSFDKLNLEKWLLVNTSLDFLPNEHIVHRYIAAARKLGVVYDGLGLDHYIPAAAVVQPASFSAQLSPGNYIAFVIGATHATKRMTPEKMLAICRQLQRPVAILGGKAETETGQFLAEQGGVHVVNLCGRLSIHQSASVVQQSAMVLSHDTGLMHIAAALKKTVVSVWGSTTPKFGMYPFYPDGMDLNTTIETLGLKCRPCSKIGYDKCPKGHFKCMEMLEVAQVVAALS